MNRKICFLAVDAIREGHVTGVQTCALPILCDRLSGTHWGHCLGRLASICPYSPRLNYGRKKPRVRPSRQKIGRASCREEGSQEVIDVRHITKCYQHDRDYWEDVANDEESYQ